MLVKYAQIKAKFSPIEVVGYAYYSTWLHTHVVDNGMRVLNMAHYLESSKPVARAMLEQLVALGYATKKRVLNRDVYYACEDNLTLDGHELLHSYYRAVADYKTQLILEALKK